MQSVTNRILITFGSVGALLAIWAITASFLGIRALPSPTDVFHKLAVGIVSGELPFHLGVTLARVAVSFSLSMVLGSIIGLIMGRFLKINQFFDFWLILLLNVPALVIIILCYIWFGLTELAAILAVIINKVPNVAATMREGARSLEKQYFDVATVYRLSPWKTLRYVILPQLSPYFAAAARTGLALVWKIVLIVELLGRSNGVGFQLHFFFQFFDVSSILAYAISFIIIVQCIELLIFRPWEWRANRWRP